MLYTPRTLQITVRLSYDCLTSISSVCLLFSPCSSLPPLGLCVFFSKFSAIFCLLLWQILWHFGAQNSEQMTAKYAFYWILWARLSPPLSFARCLSKDDAPRLLTWPDFIPLQLFWRLAGFWFLFFLLGGRSRWESAKYKFWRFSFLPPSERVMCQRIFILVAPSRVLELHIGGLHDFWHWTWP